MILTVTDVPGHRDFISNMIKGTANADTVILIVSAQEEEFELGFSSEGQTREHALLAFTMGVKQMIVCINKMDSVDWGEERYNKIKMEVAEYLKKIGYATEKIPFIPISGWTADNLIDKSAKMPWYDGPNLVEALESIEIIKRYYNKLPLRVPIQDFYKI